MNVTSRQSVTGPTSAFGRRGLKDINTGPAEPCYTLFLQTV